MRILPFFLYLLLLFQPHSSASAAPISISMITVCLRSHLRMILSLAQDFSTRPEVLLTFIIPSECEAYVLSLHFDMKVVAIPTPVCNTPHPTSYKSYKDYVAAIEKAMLEHYIDLWKMPENRPDVVLASNHGLAAADLAEMYGLKLVVLYPNMGTYHALADGGFMREDNSMSTPTEVLPVSDYALVRTYRHFIRNYSFYSYNGIFSSGRNDVRKGFGMGEVASLMENGPDRRHVVLIEGYFDFVEPKLLPPYIVLTGPLILNVTSMPNAPDIAEWVQQTEAFVYVAFGTLLEFTEYQQGIIEDLIKSSSYHFLVVSKVFKTELKNVKVVNFTNQLDVLQSSKVLAYITHGGQGGVMEAAYSLVPVLCVPQGKDQFYICDRVQATGIGKMIKPSELTVERIRGDLDELISSSAYRKALDRAKLIMNSYRGAKEAVDLVMVIAEIGYDHLFTNWDVLPWYKKNDLDIFAVYAGVVFCGIKAVRWGWYRGRR